MSNWLYCGADIGGSHITCALVEKSGVIVPGSKVRREINSQADGDTILESWSSTILEACCSGEKPIQEVGLAMPGPFDYNNGISYIKGQHKYEGLYGVDVKQKLAALLAMQPDVIHFTNDAACFLAGEMAVSNTGNSGNVLGLTLGTGLGSAIAVNNSVADANLWCLPFLEGIAEDYLSSRWFIKRFKELIGVAIPDVKELARLYGDLSEVKTIFDEFGIHIALFIREIEKSHAFDTVILGGNISKSMQFFISKLEMQLQKEGMPVRVKQSVLGEEAALVGAVSAFLDARQEVKATTARLE